MSLFSDALATYNANLDVVGKKEEHTREPLCPVGHIIQNAHIEITLNEKGEFLRAAIIEPKDRKTIIPCTEASAVRSTNLEAHPLCEQLAWMTTMYPEKHSSYAYQLQSFRDHVEDPFIKAVAEYILNKQTIIEDLVKAGIIWLTPEGELPKSSKKEDAKKKQAKGKNPAAEGPKKPTRINGAAFEKCVIRWRVEFPEGARESWKDARLFAEYTEYFLKYLASGDVGVCMITGETTRLTESYDKGIASWAYGAKLISANDSSNFTYRGLYKTPSQCCSVGLESSQKASRALRWLTANQGVLLGGTLSQASRVYICWNPDGVELLFPFTPILPVGVTIPARTPSEYMMAVQSAIKGYRNALPEDGDAIVAGFCASTKGRLATIYYNKLNGSDYYDRIQRWYETLCWNHAYFGTYSPNVRNIVKYAYGTQDQNAITGRWEVCIHNEALERLQLQALFSCIVDNNPLPEHIVNALVHNAGRLVVYREHSARETLLATACACVKKYLNDRMRKEEYTMNLEPWREDRSYQFGRLLAVLDYAEGKTYARKDKKARDTNAMQLQTMFTERPMKAMSLITKAVLPYLNKLPKPVRDVVESLRDEIMLLLNDMPANKLNRPLEPTYLLGFSAQRDELRKMFANTKIVATATGYELAEDTEDDEEEKKAMAAAAKNEAAVSVAPVDTEE